MNLSTFTLCYYGRALFFNFLEENLQAAYFVSFDEAKPLTGTKVTNHPFRD